PAKNSRMEGFYPSVKNTGVSGEGLNRRDGDTQLLNIRLGAPGTVKLYSKGV
ncbi:MAG: hypothetical protein RIQ78_988, partial [Bacteroidota bacterium]